MKKILTEHKGELVLSSLVTLLPALAGWQMAWEAAAFLLGHWLVLLVVFSDRRNRDRQSKKAIRLILWVMPFLSLLVGGVTVLLRRGIQSAGAGSAVMAMGFGLLFIVVGNYMPKIRQNSFMGIRVKWTLENEANWNASHRFGGKVWVAGGFACLAGAMLPVKAMGVAFPVVLVTVALAPIAYSYYYSKTQPAAEKTVSAPLSLWQKRAARTIVAAVAVIAVWALLSGSTEIVYDSASFTVEASGWEDLTVPYSEIAAVEYLPAEDVPETGMRTYGLGNLRVSFGYFSNEAYGSYIRYTYDSCKDCVRLTRTDGSTILLNGPDQPATRAICDALAERMGN